MKKTKFIAGTLVLSMGLLGTGYAYWTDGLSVNATVSTGELNVEWVERGQTPVYYNQDPSVSEMGEYTVTKLEEGTKTTELSIENMYPGSRVSYYANAENKGTIPVKVSDIKIEAIGLDEDSIQLEDELIFTGYYTLYQKGINENDQLNIPIDSSKGLIQLNLELDEKLKELNENDILPGSDIHFRIDAQLNPAVENGYQNQKVKLKTTIDWTQYNDPSARSNFIPLT